MAKDLNRSIKVLLDGSDAQQKLNSLSQRSDELTASIAALNEQGKGQSREAKAMEKQLEATTTQMEKTQAKISDTERVMNNLETATKSELQALKRSLEQRVANTRGTEEYSAAITQLNRVKAQLRVQNSEVSESEESLKDKLMKAPGIVGAATKSVVGLGTAMKALILNPVGAFLAAIAAAIAICIKAFKNFGAASEEGGLRTSSALAPIKVLTTALGQALKWLGGYIANVVNAIGQAIYKVTGWLSQYSDKAKEIHDRMTRQYEIEKDRYSLQQRSKNLLERQAQIENEQAELRLKAMQKDKYSLNQRKQFLEKYLAKENELSQLKVDQAQAEYDLFKKESEQDDNTYEDNVKLAQLHANVTKARTDSLQKIAGMERRRQSAYNEMLGIEATKAKEVTKAVEERKDAEEDLAERREQLLGKVNKLVQDQADSELSTTDRKLKEISRKYAEAQLELDQAMADKALSEQEYLDASEKLSNTMVLENAAVARATQEEAAKKVEQEKIKLTEEANAVREQLDTDALQTAYDKEMEHLDKLHQAKMLSDEEFEKASLRLKLNYMQQELEKRKNYLSKASTAVSSVQTAETARLEAKMQRELKMAGNDADKKKAIENKYAKEKLDVEKRYADVNFAIRISEIAASTAAAIMQCFAQLGPIGGAVAAAMVGVTGAAQIVAANAERKKVKSMTLDSSTDSSDSSTTASAVSGSVVLNGGYTVSNKEVQPDWNPSTPSISTGGISSLSSMAETEVSDTSTSSKSDPWVMQEVASLLRDLKENGVKAPVVLSEIEAKQELMRTSKNYASK